MDQRNGDGLFNSYVGEHYEGDEISQKDLLFLKGSKVLDISSNKLSEA